jgi:hypothetical protein
LGLKLNNFMSIQVNMDKARKIWQDQWRAARIPLLEGLDVEFMRAVESGDQDKQAEVAAKKQELRDVTLIDISHVDEPGELQTQWPGCLGDKPEVR